MRKSEHEREFDVKLFCFLIILIIQLVQAEEDL